MSRLKPMDVIYVYEIAFVIREIFNSKVFILLAIVQSIITNVLCYLMRLGIRENLNLTYLYGSWK